MMKQVDLLHKQAMEKADLAFIARRKRQEEESRLFSLQAFELEKKAAMTLLNQFDSEPSRSILFRSAAHMAMENQKYRDAEQMAALALAGNPPAEMIEELRQLLDEIRLQQLQSESPSNTQQIEGSFLALNLRSKDFMFSSPQHGLIDGHYRYLLHDQMRHISFDESYRIQVKLRITSLKTSYELISLQALPQTIA